MALIVKDRVLETCSTSGLVDFTLTGAVTGYQRFSAIGNGNTTYYAAYVIGSNDWEVGIGTVGTSSLTRDTILSSSTGSKVNFTGNPVVWCDLPSSKALFIDSANNASANSFLGGFTIVEASATPITLTVASTPDYVVTGSGGQTIKLPDATTLPNGTVFSFDNNQSSGAITVNNNSNTLVVSVPSGGYVYLRLLSNAIAAGSWDRHDLAPSNVSWSTNTFDYPGSITSATWNGSTVAYNRGGTGQSSAFVAGGIVYGSSTTALAVTAIGTTGQALLSNGASAPTWGNPTASAGGSTTQVQYNSSGALAGSANMTFNGTTLTLVNDASVAGLTVGRGAGSVASNTVVGNAALGSNVSGTNLVAIGQQALRVNTASNNTVVGYQAGYNNTTGGNIVAIGYQALAIGTGVGSSTAVGYQALYSDVLGLNTAVGYRALYSNTTGGSYNDAFGNLALFSNTSGYFNSAFGRNALTANTSGTANVGFGNSTLSKNTTGSSNTSVGSQSLYNNITGAYNTAVGDSALQNTTASQNTAIGYQAGLTITTGSNNILIGYQAAPSAITVSNEITIGNSSSKVIRYPHSYSTVANLPSASTVGQGSRTFVTDALAPVFQATVAGGGAVFTPVYSDGTNWKVG